MATKTVFLEADSLELPKSTNKAAVAFVVREDEEIIGTLHVGKGSVKWVRANRSFDDVPRMEWDKFKRVMEAAE
jgi:hypothetical protein